MKMYSVDELIYECPVEALSSILGKKWVPGIIWSIKKNKIRFGELQRELDGCSKKMLIQQLDMLMEKGIILNDKKFINNTVESTYYLSESGLTLLPIMEHMIHWSNRNLICDK
jgi:DNA-binding HxlR family transcriptional regulator